MAKPILLTFKKAQRYFADKGLELSTQQVRNLARQNEIITAGVTEHTDPVSEETYKVIDQNALDKYLAWRAENPDAGRGGRKASGVKRGVMLLQDHDVQNLETLNALLRDNGWPTVTIPERKPRKPKHDGVAPESNGNGVSETKIEDLELIEVE